MAAPEPIAEFFSPYSDRFNFKPGYDWRQLAQFNALAKELGWDQHIRELQMINFQDKWIEFVTSEFGDEELPSFEELFEELDIYPVPNTTKECEQQLRRHHVNLVEVIQHRWDKRLGRTPQRIRKHFNGEAAKEYAKAENKVLSNRIASVGVLKELVR